MKSLLLFVCILAGFIVVVVGCEHPDKKKNQDGCCGNAETKKYSDSMKKFFGSKNLDLFDGFKTAELYEISLKKAKPEAARVGCYSIVKKIGLLSKESSLELKRLLSDENSYDFDTAKKCVFIPDYGLKLIDGDKRLDIAISLSTLEFKFFMNDAGKREDFDGAQKLMRSIINKTLKEEPVGSEEKK